MTVSAQKVMSVVIILVNWCAVRQAWLVVTPIVFLNARPIVYIVPVLALAAVALVGQLVVGLIDVALPVRLVVQGRMATSVAPQLNIVTLTVPVVRQNVLFPVMVSVVCLIPVVVVTDFAQMVLGVVMM